MPALSEADYEARAYPELAALVRALDALEREDFEAELAHDMLTIEFGDGSKFIVNSHRAARQIWMAAERSAWHFDWDPAKERWIAAKSGDELWSTLARVLGARLGGTVELTKE